MRPAEACIFKNYQIVSLPKELSQEIYLSKLSGSESALCRQFAWIFKRFSATVTHLTVGYQK